MGTVPYTTHNVVISRLILGIVEVAKTAIFTILGALNFDFDYFVQFFEGAEFRAS